MRELGAASAGGLLRLRDPDRPDQRLVVAPRPLLDSTLQPSRRAPRRLALHDASIRWLGDPSSPHAHYTIPAPLRIPWVYVPSSLLAWSAVGGVVQAIADVLASRGLSSELRRLEQVVTYGLTLAAAATAALALFASLPWGP